MVASSAKLLFSDDLIEPPAPVQPRSLASPIVERESTPFLSSSCPNCHGKMYFDCSLLTHYSLAEKKNI
jgi:hypothetical protein